MSKARTEIAEVLAQYAAWSPEEISNVADKIMPIVRDAVARGFENAADALQDMDDEPHAARHLLRWAEEARQQS